MKLACVLQASMTGSVPHHASHIIGYDGWGSPIYCNGHSVSGNIDSANQSKMYIEGKLVAILGSSGASTDECDGSRFYTTTGVPFMFVQGRPIVAVGDKVALYPGDGHMVSANQSKFRIWR